MENSIQTSYYTMGWEFKMCEKLVPHSQLRCVTLYLLQYVVIPIFIPYSVLYFPVTAAASASLEGLHLVQRQGTASKIR